MVWVISMNYLSALATRSFLHHCTEFSIFLAAHFLFQIRFYRSRITMHKVEQFGDRFVTIQNFCQCWNFHEIMMSVKASNGQKIGTWYSFDDSNEFILNMKFLEHALTDSSWRKQLPRSVMMMFNETSLLISFKWK